MADYTVRTIKGDNITIRDERELEALTQSLIGAGFVSTTKVSWAAHTEIQKQICILAHAVESITPKDD